MLVGNICLTGFICCTTHISIAVFTLQNDLKQIQYQDSLCIFRGYMSYASLALHVYSYVLSAIHQYTSVVYPTRLFWKSARTQIFLIVISWILAFVFLIPVILTGAITYNVDNQICQVPFRFSLPIIYILNFVFIIPVNLAVFVYMKLVRYVRKMGKRANLGKTLSGAQRDFQMVRRIVILIHILLIGGVPMSLFIFLSFENLAPKYHMRIGFICVQVSLPSVMIALFQFTDLLKKSIRKIICGQSSVVNPTLMTHPTIFFENKTFENRIRESIQFQNVEILKYRRITILK
jgi:hypothetical protein